MTAAAEAKGDKMALFDRKKKKTEEEKPVVQNEAPEAAAEAQEGAEAAPAQPPVKKVDASVFSQRTAGIFGRMYRMIISVDLQSNVYQIESGEQRIGATPLPTRGYYEKWLDMIKENVLEEDQERFAEEFSRANLNKELTGPDSGISSVYCLTDNPDDERAAEYHYYEFRADRIPNPGQAMQPLSDDIINPGKAAPKTPERVRCIIYLRQIKEKRTRRHIDPEFLPEGGQTERDWNSLRVSKLVGGLGTIFFEYEVATDTLTQHVTTEAGYSRTVLKNYILNIETRGDWTVFHSDLGVLRDAIIGATKGLSQTADIRYRTSGTKNEKYRTYRLTCAPAEDILPVQWVIGAMADVEEEAQRKKSIRDITGQDEKLFEGQGNRFYELDLNRDLIFDIKRTEEGFERGGAPKKLSDYINARIAKQLIDPAMAKEYQQWLKPGYLERKTMGGSYEFESRLKDIGEPDYTWYGETIVRLGGSQKYLRMCRDISTQHAERAKAYEAEEQSKYLEFTQNLLDTLASLVEFRNVESGSHISHVRNLTRILLEDVANRSPQYELDRHKIDMYSQASIMHDIGKIVVPDHILNKQGKYTPEEFAIMKRHTTDGARIVERLNMPGQEELMKYCREVALHHHERFDGSGYPDGLVGDDIPIGVQAVGLADVYDAMLSVRCYKESFSHEDTVREILEGKSGSFNPKLIESFKICLDRMHSLYTDQEAEHLNKADYSMVYNEGQAAGGE